MTAVSFRHFESIPSRAEAVVPTNFPWRVSSTNSPGTGFGFTTQILYLVRSFTYLVAVACFPPRAPFVRSVLVFIASHFFCEWFSRHTVIRRHHFRALSCMEKRKQHTPPVIESMLGTIGYTDEGVVKRSFFNKRSPAVLHAHSP